MARASLSSNGDDKAVRGLVDATVCIPHGLLANTLQQSGQLNAAIGALNESVQLYRELAAYDPQNYEWQEELAWTLTLLARDSYSAMQSSAEEARATLGLATEALSRINEKNTAEIVRVYAAIDMSPVRVRP